MAKHEDALGREIKLGDLVALSSSYNGNLFILIVGGFSEKGISALSYYTLANDHHSKLQLLEANLKKAKKGNKICAGWSTTGWGGRWGVNSRIVKLTPQSVFDKQEMKVYNQIKDILHGEERQKTTSIRL